MILKGLFWGQKAQCQTLEQHLQARQAVVLLAQEDFQENCVNQGAHKQHHCVQVGAPEQAWVASDRIVTARAVVEWGCQPVMALTQEDLQKACVTQQARKQHHDTQVRAQAQVYIHFPRLHASTPYLQII